MTKAFRITYTVNGNTMTTVWYGHTAKGVGELFVMWHTNAIIVSVESVTR